MSDDLDECFDEISQGKGGKRDWKSCPGTGMEAKWKETGSGWERPYCPICAVSGFKTVGDGKVPRHRPPGEKVERDYKAEFARRVERMKRAQS